MRVRWDLVVTDLVTPDMAGIELIRALRHGRAPVKILASSGAGGRGGAGYLDMARALGAGGVLGKPFAAADLLPALSRR